MPDMRGAASRLLPSQVLMWLVDLRAIERRYRATFLRLELQRAIRGDRRHDWSRVRSILFVCHGNILRSPMAAELLRRSLQSEGRTEIQVASAGVYATDGGPADERAVMSAAEFGLSLLSHRSRLLTQAIVAEADVIFIMDRRNEATLIGRFPEAKKKLVPLGYFLPRSARRSIFIPDPYGGTIDDVKDCYRTIAIAIDALVRHLRVTIPAMPAAERAGATTTSTQPQLRRPPYDAGRSPA